MRRLLNPAARKAGEEEPVDPDIRRLEHELKPTNWAPKSPFSITLPARASSSSPLQQPRMSLKGFLRISNNLKRCQLVFILRPFFGQLG